MAQICIAPGATVGWLSHQTGGIGAKTAAGISVFSAVPGYPE